MNRSKIEWIEFQWNPLTGCLGECDYCISRKKSKRFTGDKRMNLVSDKYTKDGELFILDQKFVAVTGGTLNYPFGFEPTFHRYRLDNLNLLKGTMNILVCGDGELFGPWVPDGYIEEVFDSCKKYPKHHYLFLTRYPERYEKMAEKGKLPKGDNYWYGHTVCNGTEVHWNPQGEYHTFICMEPLLENIKAVPVEVEWVVIGAETGNRKGKVIPEFDWVKEIVVACDYKSIPIFMTNSLLDIMPKNSMRKDYPKYILEKELSDKLRKKLFDICYLCGREHKKSEMITLLARSARGEQPKQFCFMCKDCFRQFCSKNGVDMPKLKDL